MVRSFMTTCWFATLHFLAPWHIPFFEGNSHKVKTWNYSAPSLVRSLLSFRNFEKKNTYIYETRAESVLDIKFVSSPSASYGPRIFDTCEARKTHVRSLSCVCCIHRWYTTLPKSLSVQTSTFNFSSPYVRTDGQKTDKYCEYNVKRHFEQELWGTRQVTVRIT